MRDFGFEILLLMMWFVMGVLLMMRDAVKVFFVVDEVVSCIYDCVIF